MILQNVASLFVTVKENRKRERTNNTERRQKNSGGGEEKIFHTEKNSFLAKYIETRGKNYHYPMIEKWGRCFGFKKFWKFACNKVGGKRKR